MVMILGLYLALVYLIFFKLKLLPFNKVRQAIVVLIGTIILTGFLVGLLTLTPASVQAFVGGFITEIPPEAPRRALEVSVAGNARVEPSEVLFRIDPRPYQYRVDQLKAQLVETEAYVGQLKEAYDAARAETQAIHTQLALSELRVEQSKRLVSAHRLARAFETEVWPILEKHCIKCHGEKQAYSNLRLDSPAAIRRGGELGEVLVPGDPEASEIYRRTALPTDDLDYMPVDSEPLNREELKRLHDWIAAGADFGSWSGG